MNAWFTLGRGGFSGNDQGQGFKGGRARRVPDLGNFRRGDRRGRWGMI